MRKTNINNPEELKQFKLETLKTGRLVEAIMKYRGLKVKDLADVIGWHPMNVYKLLNGRLDISDDIAIRIAEVLKCSSLLIMLSRSIDLTKIENEKV